MAAAGGLAELLQNYSCNTKAIPSVSAAKSKAVI